MLGTTDLLRDSAQLYRDYAWTYIGYAAWMLIPFAGFVALIYLPSGTLSDVLAVLFVAVQLFLSIWISIILIDITNTLFEQKEVPHEQANQTARRRLLPVVSTTIVHALVIFGGFLLLIIPGIIFSVWYAFAQTAAVLDDKQPIAALTHSRELVRGKFAQVIWRLISGPGTILIIYLFILSAIIMIIGSLTGMDPETAFSNTTFLLWTQILEMVGEILLMPLFLIYMTRLYRELKFAKV